jgi:hypothetical protein
VESELAREKKIKKLAGNSSAGPPSFMYQDPCPHFARKSDYPSHSIQPVSFSKRSNFWVVIAVRLVVA